MNASRFRLSLLLLSLLALLASAGLALAVPQQIDYQGKLTDSAGTPINGATSMVFRIWNHVSAGSVVWAETQAVVNVESGLFHVNLGGNVDDSVVDIISKDTGDPVQAGINNHGIGFFVEKTDKNRGFFFNKLTTTSIAIFRASNDGSFHELRVRI